MYIFISLTVTWTLLMFSLVVVGVDLYLTKPNPKVLHTFAVSLALILMACLNVIGIRFIESVTLI